MKKLIIVLTVLLLISPVTRIAAAGLDDHKSRKEKRASEKAEITKIVESGKFIVKFDRLTSMFGGMTFLMPRLNYIILDKGDAVISTAYIGRQYDIRPIVGISVAGRASHYSMKKNSNTGSFRISLKVQNGGDILHVALNISSTGRCDASISGLRIQTVSYSGYLVPVKETKAVPLQEGEVI